MHARGTLICKSTCDNYKHKSYVWTLDVTEDIKAFTFLTPAVQEVEIAIHWMTREALLVLVHAMDIDLSGG